MGVQWPGAQWSGVECAAGRSGILDDEDRNMRHTITVMAIIYMVANCFGVDFICTVSSTSLSHMVQVVEETAIVTKLQYIKEHKNQ
jgi:hypothetical protein